MSQKGTGHFCLIGAGCRHATGQSVSGRISSGHMNTAGSRFVLLGQFVRMTCPGKRAAQTRSIGRLRAGSGGKSHAWRRLRSGIPRTRPAPERNPTPEAVPERNPTPGAAPERNPTGPGAVSHATSGSRAVSHATSGSRAESHVGDIQNRRSDPMLHFGCRGILLWRDRGAEAERNPTGPGAESHGRGQLRSGIPRYERVQSGIPQKQSAEDAIRTDAI